MIRTLTASDANSMASIHGLAFDHAWSAAEMRTHAEKDICLGYADPLQGFIIIQPAADQAEVLTLVTEKAYRRTGIAHKLLHAGCVTAAKQGVEILFLEVAEDNIHALSLYEKSGFEKFGRRPAYYRRENGRVAAITLRKRLDA